MSVAYAPGRRPLVTLDCGPCQGTGLGVISSGPCVYCKGRGYFTHSFDPLCDCLGCQEVRGEVDEDGNPIEREDA